MSRFLRQPFAQQGPFVALRPFLMSGRAYKPGDAVPVDNVEPRRVRQMWDMRVIENGTPKSAATTAAAAPAAMPEAVAPAPAPVKPRLKVEHRGFGRHYVIAEDGAETGPLSKEAADKLAG